MTLGFEYSQEQSHFWVSPLLRRHPSVQPPFSGRTHWLTPPPCCLKYLRLPQSLRVSLITCAWVLCEPAERCPGHLSWTPSTTCHSSSSLGMSPIHSCCLHEVTVSFLCWSFSDSPCAANSEVFSGSVTRVANTKQAGPPAFRSLLALLQYPLCSPLLQTLVDLLCSILRVQWALSRIFLRPFFQAE